MTKAVDDKLMGDIENDNRRGVSETGWLPPKAGGAVKHGTGWVDPESLNRLLASSMSIELLTSSLHSTGQRP